MSGYVFPNEIEVHWRLFIVLYPYITGLVAGAFIVSSLYHVFGRSELKPLARFSLLTALAFLFCAPLPLISHLGQPLRALNIMMTPHLTSAMAGFGFIYSFYLILCLLETWFLFREDIVKFAATSKGFAKLFYTILTLGAKDISPEALDKDHKIVTVLATIGIPSACFLHGYVGFIFGSIKANVWWSTPLMPIIFLLSATVSGVALLIVLYRAVTWLRRQKLELPCLMSLNSYLWIFLLLATILELLEILQMGYEGKEEWPMIQGLITNHISLSYLVIQMGFGVLIPLILLPIGRSKSLSVKKKQRLTTISGALVLVGVLAMRFNVVIGGQLISKSMAGYTAYDWTLFSHEGIISAMILMLLPLIVLTVIVRVLPPWFGEVKVPKKNAEVVPPINLKLQPKVGVK
ncbi:MAG: NrfD/PsrC family molybdoenzyme membrane anchor subunit [Desulfitobacteriaceae bacterium]